MLAHTFRGAVNVPSTSKSAIVLKAEPILSLVQKFTWPGLHQRSSSSTDTVYSSTDVKDTGTRELGT